MLADLPEAAPDAAPMPPPPPPPTPPLPWYFALPLPFVPAPFDPPLLPLEDPACVPSGCSAPPLHSTAPTAVGAWANVEVAALLDAFLDATVDVPWAFSAAEASEFVKAARSWRRYHSTPPSATTPRSAAPPTTVAAALPLSAPPPTAASLPTAAAPMPVPAALAAPAALAVPARSAPLLAAAPPAEPPAAATSLALAPAAALAVIVADASHGTPLPSPRAARDGSAQSSRSFFCCAT